VYSLIAFNDDTIEGAEMAEILFGNISDKRPAECVDI